MIRTIATIAFCIVGLAAGGGASAEPIALSAKPVLPGSDDGGPRDMGALVWRGGLELTSPDPRFGGLSGLLVEPDGTRAIAVSDNGEAVLFDLLYDEPGHLAGVTAGEIVPLTDLRGRALSVKRQRDAESLARLPDGSILVGFEHRHRVQRYPASAAPFGGRPVGYPAPLGLARATDNEGLEALAVLEDGRVLAVLEGRESDAEAVGFLGGDGLWASLRIAKDGLFRPTGATRLPDGRIVLLERRFTVLGGPAARLVIFEAEDLKPGPALTGREVARLAPPLPIDNMEGIAARRNDRGETLVYLVSDDNFFGLQRTLLLMFALEE